MDKYIVILRKNGKLKVSIFKDEKAYLSFWNKSKRDENTLIENIFMVPVDEIFKVKEVLSVCNAFASEKIDKEEMEMELSEFLIA
jgi:hypothetical protein